MKQQILSAVITLCLCISSSSASYARQINPLLQEEVFTEGSASGLAVRDSTVLTPTEIYEAMTALKDQDAYKEGTTWTDDEPYSDAKGYYRWKGGTLDGKNISAVGCVAFAFTLSDAAFGSLPARMYAAGGFDFADIRIGDILRMNTDTHTVIVLEVSETGVVVAEGNYTGKVHWGRTISKEVVMRDTSHYITRYPEGYVAPDDPEADVSIAAGTLEGGLAWNLTKAGTLSISGRGAMPDFSSAGDQPWNAESSQIRKIVIEEGITSIASCAFWNCGVLSAEIPSSVTAVGNSAFRGSSIISVTIPSSVKTIGDSAFRECQNLSSVTISEGVETIVQNAFRGCTGLTSIALPASVGEVGAGAFFQCTAMISASFAPGSKQVKMGDNMFTGCYYLMGVTLPRNIDRIGEGMFQNCRMLAGVEIPQGAESIGGSAFASCSGFTTVIIPDSVTTIGIAAFSACPLTDIYFTGTEEQWNRISKIGDTASAVSKAAKHYNYIPDETPDPGEGDNSGGGDNSGENSGGNPGDNNGNNSGGNSGNNTGNNSGGNSGNNTGNNSGGNPEDNNGNSGGGNSGNNTGNNSGGNPGDSNGNNSGGSSGTNNGGQTPLAKGKTFTTGKITYKVTKAGKEVELTAAKSTAGKVTVNTVTGPDGVKYKVTSVGAKAMQNNKKMTSLVIGSNVKKIGANACSGCTKLASVTVGKHVAAIGASAFKGCTALKKTLTLPDSVKTIGADAFSGCSRITAVTIGKTSKSSLKTIGKNAFKGCKKLRKVTICSTKLASVGKQAFQGVKSSLKVKVPSKQQTKYKKLLKKAGLK